MGGGRGGGGQKGRAAAEKTAHGIAIEAMRPQTWPNPGTHLPMASMGPQNDQTRSQGASDPIESPISISSKCATENSGWNCSEDSARAIFGDFGPKVFCPQKSFRPPCRGRNTQNRQETLRFRWFFRLWVCNKRHGKTVRLVISDPDPTRASPRPSPRTAQNVTKRTAGRAR